jgi:hypothetical protein
MTITKNYSDSNGADVQRATGRYLDDAATPAAAVIELGFKPRYFLWLNLTDRDQWEKFEGMLATETLATIETGVRSLDTGSIVVFDAASGLQSGTPGTPDATNAGVRNNVAYPGPSTVVNDTRTALPGSKAGHSVTIAASVILQNKQYTWIALG